ncbi:MAG: DUF4982 domain-containing protein, partial [Oscillospiraceae bacterium]|nr:DUF4982 domain-containing protein [Oscillospiraceae bacterium]
MFKRVLAMLLLTALVLSVMPAIQGFAAATVTDTEGPRQEIDFNDDWRFYLATTRPTAKAGGFAAAGLEDDGGVTTAEVIATAFDDSGWRTVNVPHDWSVELQKLADAPGGGTNAYFEGGLGWYRKTFVLPASFAGRRIFVDFEGVYQNSEVYVNGQLIGNYPSGYTGFAYDITDKLVCDGSTENVVVVKVQNLSPSGRWYTGSGIVRPVKLVVTNKTWIQRNGLVYTTPSLETTYNADGSAVLDVSATVRSEDTNGRVKLRTIVWNGNSPVASRNSDDEKDCNPGSATALTNQVTVPSVRLWSTEDPFRYTVTTEVIYTPNGGNAQITDSVSVKYGFRYFSIDPEKGFFLNGQHLKIQGVDLHHDSGALGAASYHDAYYREMSILKSMGVNAYRTSHNPPSKQMIDVCSELGIVVMEEAYDGWGAAKGGSDFGLFFLMEVPAAFPGLGVSRTSGDSAGSHLLWSDWVIREMVLRDINEPSVTMWSVGNEVRGVGSKPAWYKWEDYWLGGKNVIGKKGAYDNYTKPALDAAAFNEFTEAIRLRNNILSVDKTRYIAMGGDQERTPPAKTDMWGYVNQSLDGYGLNYNTAASVSKLIADYPNTFFFESESSSQTGARGVYFSPSLPNTPPNQTPGSRGTSAYDNNFASWTMPNEYGLKKDRDREAFLGQFIWSGFDYLGEPTPYGIYPVGVSSFGTVDTAGFPKDSYYLFKSQWTTDPMAHIVPMNWNDWYPNEEVEVWVYTNAAKAELFLNGTSLGVRSFDKKATTYGKEYYETTEPTKDGAGNGYKTNAETNVNNPGGYVSPNNSYGKLHLTWKVPYAPGTLSVKAMNETDTVVATDTLSTAGPAYTIDVTPDKEHFEPDGDSLVYFACDIVDEDGVVRPSANNLVKFDVTGGYIVGVDNGKQESNELYKWGNVEKNTHSERSAYNGKVLVIVRPDENSTGITLTVSADDLVSSVVTVPARTGTPNIAPVALGAAVSAETRMVKAQRGVPAILPKDVRVTYENGTQIKQVTWTVDPSIYDTAGEKTVSGVFADMSLASLTPQIGVYVVDTATRKNIGLDASLGAGNQTYIPQYGPLATASFTSNTNYPNNMLNGAADSYWDNYATPGATVVLDDVTTSRAYDWVQTYWPDEQTFDEVRLFFTTNADYALPDRLNVQYWDGFSWLDAPNQQVTRATESNTATVITFGIVTSSRVRVQMWKAPPLDTATGRMRIVSFETWAPDLDAGSHVISYDLNYATAKTVSDQYVLPGRSALVKEIDAGLVQWGNTFAAWNTETDGTGVKYDPNDTIAPAEDLTLYAIWTPIPGWVPIRIVINKPAETPVYVPGATVSSPSWWDPSPEFPFPFSVDISGSGSPEQVQEFTWSVSGNADPNTSILEFWGVITLIIGADETSPQITLRAESVADPTKYDEAAVIIRQSTVTVTAVTITPSEDVTVAPGGTETFSAVVAGTNAPPQLVTWAVTGGAHPGTAISQAGVLTVDIGEAVGATLTVRATSAYDPAKSDSVDVEIVEGPPPPQTPVFGADLPATAAVTAGRSHTLTVSASVTDGGTLSYQWYKDGAAMAGATGPSYVIASAAAADAGVYFVVVTNTTAGGEASETSGSVTVTVVSGGASSSPPATSQTSPKTVPG